MRLQPRLTRADHIPVAIHDGDSSAQKVKGGVFALLTAPRGPLDLAASVDPDPMGHQSNHGCPPCDKGYADPFVARQSEPRNRRPNADRASDDRGQPARGKKQTPAAGERNDDVNHLPRGWGREEVNYTVEQQQQSHPGSHSMTLVRWNAPTVIKRKT